MGGPRQERRVALVLGTSAGGVGRHVRMLADGLTRRGLRVVVAGPAATRDAFGFPDARFVPVGISDRPHPLRDARAVMTLRRLAREADVLHAHGLRAGALAGLAGLPPARGRARLVVTLHNALTAGGAVGAVYAVLERIVARTAATVLTVSPDLAERMSALGARHVEAAVVPAPPLPAPRRGREEVRRELGAAPGRPVLLTVARLAQQKGLETLLDAAAGFAASPSPPLFAVAGDGPLAAGLRERIEREGLPVRLLGHRDDVADLLAAADAVVVPSRWEGQPLSVQEALRAGRPVVATAVGGVPAMVGDAGVLVPYGDAAALRAAVARLLGDPEEARRLGEAAARRGRTLPGEEEALSAVLDAYTATLARER
ncbi:glycosyltransferase family 4 protein [Thermostaphylospora chromogena]|uniref:Glycosyltransferase involved in cell wall bisynthesis n=1 Tax=Thermostaphylospora chromogena TaxID=35622 RepID=A0A1H1HLW7_9ACTN|nr:glycosyltransferase family 4 protein [Thermostaphylospora chromogena]SDR26329.1 Glycosyltransferase involved in cell wall bisynthesis [Thermostaphylospora chromogena]